MLRFLTAGESHGEGLVAIIEGMPYGFKINTEFINQELRLRQSGYGRGKRMSIEKDSVIILSGLRHSMTLGSPIAVLIKNKDFKINSLPAVLNPRPGHADLAGALKFGTYEVRDILERSSARETASRVAIGAIGQIFLKEFNIELVSHVVSIGPVEADTRKLSFDRIKELSKRSSLLCADLDASKRMEKLIDEVGAEGDTLGGIFEIRVKGLPPGLGSHVEPDRKLDAKIAGAIMSIQAIKGVEIGMGFAVAKNPGSKVHDEIIYSKNCGFTRPSNNAGGIEGGISNGQEVIVRAAMKPIATLRKPLNSVNIKNKAKHVASVERSDVVAVSAASLVAKNVVALEIASAMLEKFGSDSRIELKRNYEGYLKALKKF